MKNFLLLCFYVPESHAEFVKDAVFKAGAGAWGNYSHVAWQTLGMGQFKPLAGSNPSIGEQDTMATVPEYKIELLCAADKISAVVNALMEAHPYEEPAYFVLKPETN